MWSMRQTSIVERIAATASSSFLPFFDSDGDGRITAEELHRLPLSLYIAVVERIAAAAAPMAGILSSVRRIYLTLYNWTVFFGWLQVFYIAVTTLRDSGYESVYAAVEKPLILAQSAALVEILHSLVGLVRSPVTATLPQVASRIYLTWGILYSFPEIQTHFFVSSLVIG